MKNLFIVLLWLFLAPVLLTAQPVMEYPKELDYGVVLVNSDPNRKLTFYNRGDEPLVILTARASVGTVVPRYPKEPVMPGDSAFIEVRYDTKKRGTFKHEILFKTNENPDYQVFTVQGDVRNSLEEQPTEDYFMSQGRFKLGIGKAYLGAVADFDRVIRLNPKNTEAYYLRAKAYGNLEEWDHAIQDFTTVIELDPNHWKAYQGRGLAKGVREIGDGPGAIADLTAAIALNPENADLYHSRGISREMQKDFQGAIADHSQAIQLDRQARYYESRGRAKFELNQKDAACEDLYTAKSLGSRKAAESIEKYCD